MAKNIDLTNTSLTFPGLETGIDMEISPGIVCAACHDDCIHCESHCLKCHNTCETKWC